MSSAATQFWIYWKHVMQHESYLQEQCHFWRPHSICTPRSYRLQSMQTLYRIYAAEKDVEKDRLVFTMNTINQFFMTQKLFSFLLCLIHTIFHWSWFNCKENHRMLSMLIHVYIEIGSWVTCYWSGILERETDHPDPSSLMTKTMYTANSKWKHFLDTLRNTTRVKR